jgi:hypothetical protein
MGWAIFFPIAIASRQNLEILGSITMPKSIDVSAVVQ